jgi:acetylornithine aminotransferase/acetylornithine/N-succinyldiaminopimelate aminotransferase
LGSFWAGTRSTATVPLCDLLGPGTHGTTYGGNPLVAAAGLTVLLTIQEEGLLENARNLGLCLISELQAMNLPAIRLVRGVGLMIGIELNDLTGEGLPSIIATKALMAAGLLVIPSGERTIRLLPPLNITKTEADRALAILREVLSAMPVS